MNDPIARRKGWSGRTDQFMPYISHGAVYVNISSFLPSPTRASPLIVDMPPSSSKQDDKVRCTSNKVQEDPDSRGVLRKRVRSVIRTCPDRL